MCNTLSNLNFSSIFLLFYQAKHPWGGGRSLQDARLVSISLYFSFVVRLASVKWKELRQVYNIILESVVLQQSLCTEGQAYARQNFKEVVDGLNYEGRGRDKSTVKITLPRSSCKEMFKVRTLFQQQIILKGVSLKHLICPFFSVSFLGSLDRFIQIYLLPCLDSR